MPTLDGELMGNPQESDRSGEPTERRKTGKWREEFREKGSFRSQAASVGVFRGERRPVFTISNFIQRSTALHITQRPKVRDRGQMSTSDLCQPGSLADRRNNVRYTARS